MLVGQSQVLGRREAPAAWATRHGAVRARREGVEVCVVCGVWVWMCGWVWEDADRGLGSSWARKGEQPLGPTKVGA